MVCSWLILKEKYIDLSPILIYNGDIVNKVGNVSIRQHEASSDYYVQVGNVCIIVLFTS
jgi:hypothetical protein